MDPITIAFPGKVYAVKSFYDIVKWCQEVRCNFCEHHQFNQKKGFWRPLTSSGMVAGVNGREGDPHFGEQKLLEFELKAKIDGNHEKSGEDCS